MNTHYTYFIILLASLAGPLVLSFDKKVAFYKKWKYVCKAMLLPALFYIIWDIVFTKQSVWSFNDNYITGFKIINLPIEEVLFFFVVPYCCLFIYECIYCYFPKWHGKNNADTILKFISWGLLIIAIVSMFYGKLYTGFTSLFLFVFIKMVYFFKHYFKSFDASSFLISYLIALIPFLIVNGFLTAIPVVLYNDAENLGVRIYTIPVEDIFYGMLLIMTNVVIYEKLIAKDNVE